MRNDLKNGGKTTSDPQEIAILVLGWLASEPDILSRFLNLTGIAPNAMRQLMGDSGFQAGLLDFIMNFEPDLMAFCAATGKTPEEVTYAWNRLSGPGLDSGTFE